MPTLTKLKRSEQTAMEAARQDFPAGLSGAKLAAAALTKAAALHRDRQAGRPVPDASSPAVWGLGCLITAERDAAILAGDIKLTEAWFDAWRVFLHGPTRWDR